ncbi:MAG: hypothetical protein AB1791_22675, partial [Chloroflexota bacterium]
SPLRKGDPPHRLTIFLWLTVAAYAIYAFGYRTADAHLYFLPGLLILSLLLRCGLRLVGDWALLLPLLSLTLNFGQLRLAGMEAIRPLAQAALQEAPPAAMILTPGDSTIFALWYFQQVEGQRPDLILVDSNLFAFDWYRQRLGRRYPTLHGLEKDDLDGFEEGNLPSHPLCRVSLAWRGQRPAAANELYACHSCPLPKETI